MIRLLRRLFGLKKGRRHVRRRVHEAAPPAPSETAEAADEALAGLDFHVTQSEPVGLAATPIEVKGTFGRNASDPPRRKRR